MSSNRQESKKSRCGFVLVLTLFTTVMLATLVIALLNLTAIDLSLVRNHMYSLQAYYIAEAGIADAIDRIQKGTPVPAEWDGYVPVGTSNSYHVTVVAGATTVVTSTGIVPTANFSRTLEARVKVITAVAPYRVSMKHYQEVVR